MYKTWVELEETIGAARDGMETMLANRHKAAASREEARETLTQADVAWEEARRLGDVTWRAFDKGFTANLPGIAERLRTIREVDEARRAQADLRWASQEEAWEEADDARQKATAGLLKAIASLAAAAVQVEREMRESVNLSSFAESLRNSALEDLSGAQAIRNELALLGQRALDELKRDQLPEEANLGVRIMPEPAGPGHGTVVEPAAPLQAEPDVQERNDPPPGTGGKQPRRQQETLEGSVSPVAESPAPSAVETGGSASTATDEAGTPPKPQVAEVGDVTSMSAAEQLRREFAAGAFPPNSPEGGAPVSPTRGAGHRVERSEPHAEAPRSNPSETAASAPENEVAAPLPPMVSVERSGGPIPMPASIEPAVESAVSEGGIAERSAAATDEAASDSLPATYTGRLYLMFPSSLGQEEIGSVWEILESIASGTIVGNRLVSREAGIQFTLDLGSKEFELDQLRRRMPGALLAALGADRLKVDWPRTG